EEAGASAEEELGGCVDAIRVAERRERRGRRDAQVPVRREDVLGPAVNAPRERRVPTLVVALHEEQLDLRALEQERALPREPLRRVPVERERIDLVPRVRRVQKVEVDVLAGLDQPTELLAPAAEDPCLDAVRAEHR